MSDILRTAPPTGAPLDEWRAWARTLTPDALEALSTATARALCGVRESVRVRVRQWCADLPAPMVHVIILRCTAEVDRERRREIARWRTCCDGADDDADDISRWRNCGPTADECAAMPDPAPVAGERP